MIHDRPREEWAPVLLDGAIRFEPEMRRLIEKEFSSQVVPPPFPNPAPSGLLRRVCSAGIDPWTYRSSMDYRFTMFEAEQDFLAVVREYAKGRGSWLYWADCPAFFNQVLPHEGADPLGEWTVRARLLITNEAPNETAMDAA